jgi:hypothetical protein
MLPRCYQPPQPSTTRQKQVFCVGATDPLQKQERERARRQRHAPSSLRQTYITATNNGRRRGITDHGGRPAALKQRPLLRLPTGLPRALGKDCCPMRSQHQRRGPQVFGPPGKPRAQRQRPAPGWWQGTRRVGSKSAVELL